MTLSRSLQPIDVFILFSHADKKFLNKLEKSLAVLVGERIITICHRNNIEAGTDGHREVSRLMKAARIILLLVSSDFLASECYSADMVCALERPASGEARLIPIILKPCDWEAAPFGGLPALPDDGRPVAKWSTQDEAFSNIAKRLRLLLQEGVEFGAAKPARHFRREISPLLPYLCNRMEQEEKLSGIFCAEKAKPHRPVVCIIHGNEDEGHDMFKSRLQYHSLPKLLHRGLPGRFRIEDIWLPLPRRIPSAEQGSFRELRNNVAERVTKNREASDKDIAEALSQFRTPVIIHCYLRAEGWELNGPDLVDAFIKYWGAFPDLPLTTQLIVCLFVSYPEAGVVRSQRLTIARQGDGSRRTRDYLNRLEFSDYGGVCGIVLPEMLSIPLTDAEDYFRDDKGFSDICQLHSPSFCRVQAAVEEIRSYYKGVEKEIPAARVPMQHLAKELRRVLEKNLC